MDTETWTLPTSTGSANAQLVTFSSSPTLTTGLTFAFVAGYTNTGACSLNVNSLGAVSVYSGGIALAGGEITAGNVVNVVYDGTHFQLSPSSLAIAAVGTGAIARPMRSRISSVVNVLDFGADPTGATDSTTAINAAVTQWQLASTSAGNQFPAVGEVALYFPAGTYYCASFLPIYGVATGMTIFGDGPVSRLINIGFFVNQNRVSISSLFLTEANNSTGIISGSYGIQLANLGATPSSSTTANRSIGDFSDLIIRGKDTGFLVAASSSCDYINNVQFEKNNIGIGFSLQPTGGCDMSFTNCDVQASNYHGIYCNKCQGVKFIGCRAQNSDISATGTYYNLYIGGGTTQGSSVENYFMGSSFAGMPNTRTTPLTSTTLSADANNNLVVDVAAGHQLVAGLSGIYIFGITPYSSTTSYEVVSSTATTVTINAAYTSSAVASSSSYLAMAGWDVVIEGDTNILSVNDQYFTGCNINYIQMTNATNVQFSGSRLKEQVWVEGTTCEQILIIESSRGRQGSTFNDSVIVSGSASGWAMIGSFEDNTLSTSSGAASYGIRVPNVATPLVSGFVQQFHQLLANSATGTKISQHYSQRISLPNNSLFSFTPDLLSGMCLISANTEPLTKAIVFSVVPTAVCVGAFGGGGASVDCVTGVTTVAGASSGVLTVSAYNSGSSSGQIYLINTTGATLTVWWQLLGTN